MVDSDYFAALPRIRKADRAPPEPVQGFATVGATVERDGRMSFSARRVLGLLVQWSRGRGKCDAYVEQIAHTLGMSVRTVQRAQRRAEHCGYIRIQHRREGRTNDANLYHIEAAALPLKPTGKRRTAARRPRPYGVTVSPPHEGGAKAHPPLTPPGGKKNASLHHVAATSALKRGSERLEATVHSILKRLDGGESATAVPGTGPPE